MKNLGVFIIFLVIRVASVFLVQTFFVPDEYWQSLEVAHNLVFRYGYLTWEWTKGIRSYIPPLIIAGLYKILQITGLDTSNILVYGPRILQAILSAYSDLCFYKWSGTKKWAIFCIGTSWFWFYTGSRTLINSLECALSTIALSYFPWPGKGIENNSNFLWIISLLFVVRPTSAIIWTPLCVYHLMIQKKSMLTLLLSRYLPIGLIVLSLSILLDSLAHGTFIVTVYEFLKFNLIEDIGSFYGTQPWHWYLSSGIPAILGIQLLPFLTASFVILKNRRVHQNELAMLGTIIFALTIYSLLPHKEFRFILSLLPLIFYISSRFLSAWSRKASKTAVWLVAIFIFACNILPMWYLSMIHQRGTLDVMDALKRISLKNPNDTNLLFLMPCHSTPLYSHLHVNVTTRFLTCTPNFNKIDNYVDEADLFYENPNGWLRQNYPPNGTLPTHIICFDILQPNIRDILSRYRQTHEIFHTDFPTSRTGKFVLIHRRLD
ncbi:phosphatidylinositol glycan anchor biosynthesis class B [Leptinotarsa decemlineata]|uniref:phosphatidylinositol glycan anchor biosynthesis class B n=1 Tax=Leptinotarsa decemlineata TaxID=7539 RepID=UPI003D30AD6B